MNRIVRPGRPTGDSPETVNVHVRLTQDLHARVQAYASEKCMPMAEAIRRLVHRGLNPHHMEADLRRLPAREEPEADPVARLAQAARQLLTEARERRKMPRGYSLALDALEDAVAALDCETG